MRELGRDAMSGVSFILPEISAGSAPQLLRKGAGRL
jgi:hypothetical protein